MSVPNFNLEFIKDKDILCLTIIGDYVAEEKGDGLQVLFSKMNEYNCKKCILDYRQGNYKTTTMTSYQRPSTINRIGFKHSYKIAIVVNAITEEFRFIETVMKNNGYEFELFFSKDKAVKWLET